MASTPAACAPATGGCACWRSASSSAPPSAPSTPLVDEGVDATLWDIRVAKPLDPEMIADAATHDLVVTVEDGIREGGAGALVLEAVNRLCEELDCTSPRVEVLGVPVEFLAHGKPDQILARLGLDADGIAAAIRASLPARRPSDV